MMFKYVNEIRWQLAEQAQTYRDLEDPIMTLEVVITLRRAMCVQTALSQVIRSVVQLTRLFNDHAIAAL